MAETTTWPQWRGPRRDGFVVGKDWPKSLDETTLVRVYRVPLGPSYSGPIVADGRVFVTETKDEEWEIVRALSLETGEPLWEQKWEGSMKVPFFARSNGSWIRSTPAYDEGRLYVGGMRDVLVCLDGASGNIVWKRDFVAEAGSPLPAFGFVSSPLIDGDFLYVQVGGAFTKIDKLTGQTVWQTLKDGGGMMGSAFSSCYPANLAGRPQLLVQTRTTLAGVTRDDGKVLWSQDIPAFRGMNILTPTVYGDGVFTSSYGGKSLMLRIRGDGNQMAAEEAWSSKAQGYMSTPIIIGDYAYLHLRNQRFTCLDLRTGEEKWRTKPFGGYWSMVAQGDKILALDEEGVLRLIQASPDAFQLVDERTVSDESAWAHLAVSGPWVLVRELNALAAYRWQSP